MVFFRIFGDVMESIELLGRNSTIGKLRSFKEMTKVQNGKRLGSKCNFTKLHKGEICHGRPSFHHHLPSLNSMAKDSIKVA